MHLSPWGLASKHGICSEMSPPPSDELRKTYSRLWQSVHCQQFLHKNTDESRITELFMLQMLVVLFKCGLFSATSPGGNLENTIMWCSLHIHNILCICIFNISKYYLLILYIHIHMHNSIPLIHWTHTNCIANKVIGFISISIYLDLIQ